MKNMLQRGGGRLLLFLALVFTVISSILADRAARLEADLQQPVAQVRTVQPNTIPDSNTIALQPLAQMPALASTRRTH